jgi:type I restriction enzyme R subunit
MMQPIVIGEFYTRQNIKLTPDATRIINRLVISEYMNEFSASFRPASHYNSGA